MQTTWFILLTGMIFGYVLLDGINLGVGMLHPLIARNEDERLAVRATIGHVWHPYEVWLIAFGGLLFLAFPKVYALSFSGFYLAFMVLLWCLVGRGLALEVRPHLDQAVWRTACDILLPVMSLLIAAILGAAAGNVLRGVAIGDQGDMFLPLWNKLSTGGVPAIFDWYTITLAVAAIVAFLLHGANFLAVKTATPLHERAVRVARQMNAMALPLGIAVLLLTPWVSPRRAENYLAHPTGFLLIAATAVALLAGLFFRYRGRHGWAFVSSCALLLGVVSSIGFSLYPNMLPSTPDPARSLTIYNSAASTQGLTVGLIWFSIGISLAVAYHLYIHHVFSGTVRPGVDRY
jgi:cytochrome d ubiquinol oxidase subunit II